MWASRFKAVAFCALLLCSVTSAQAALLGLTPIPPDIVSGFIQIDYTYDGAGTGMFSATGFPLEIDLDGSPPPEGMFDNPGPGDYEIVATIQVDQSTGLPISVAGALDIQGTIPDLNVNGPNVLQGTLAAFGFEGGGQVFEFIFESLTGDLSSLFGQKAGVILSTGGQVFDGDFRNNFSNSGFGNADTFAIVPEPTTSLLVFMAGAALAGRVMVPGRGRRRGV